MTTLTDRYVYAVTRLLPPAQRPEVDRELRTMIDELVDAHRADDAGTTDAGAIGPAIGTTDHTEITHGAEYTVLAQLGDPSRLAARYVERPRALVSEELFPGYLRVLKLVLAIAVPGLIALSIVGAVLGERSAIDVIGAALNAGYHAVIQSAFWVTLVYAFAHRWHRPDEWTPDDLPEPIELTGGTSRTGVGIGEMVFNIVLTVLTAVVLVWQHVWPFVRVDGEALPVLHPDIWRDGGPALLVLLAASLVVLIAVLVRRSWTMRTAIVNAVVNAAFVGVVIWMAVDDRLLNPDVLALISDRTGWDPTVADTRIAVVIVAIVAAIEIWDTAEAFLAARRAPQEPYLLAG